MKRALTPRLAIILLVLILLPFASAEMIINQQPTKVYNLGDSVAVPITIKTIAGVSGMFSMDLLCGSKQINFYKNGVNLLAGEEKTMDASLVLTKELLGENVGTCKIKGILGEEYILTNEFKISNLLTLQPNTEETEFEPGQSILIFGDAVKDNGQPANGFIDLEIVIANFSGENIAQRGTMNNGMYSMNITLPEKMKAGKYLVKLNAYEVALDSSKTNKGFVNYNIQIKQIPTSLELIFENEEVEPGTEVEVKAILHDQTGEKIDSTAIITIKKGIGEGILVEGGGPTEKSTGEYMKLPIAYNEPPGNWTVFAMSNQLTAEAHFVITEKEEIKAEIVNETIVITNIGNVPYNSTIIIKIGENESKEYPLYLVVDGKNEYELLAPKGDYEVEVLDKDGDSKVKETVTITRSPLTGQAIRIRDASQITLGKFFSNPLVWILTLLVILAIVFIIVRRIRKKKKEPGMGSSGGGIFKKKAVKQLPANVPWENRAMPLSKESKLQTKNKANLSLSIKGNKQDVSLVNVVIKNLGEVQANKGNPEEPLQKIINLAENKKAFVYENQNNLFFILTPSKTRTFKNEPVALEIAQDAKEILAAHNRIAKHRLDFGISIEYGSIVEKTENGVMDFMSLGTLMSNAKKISSASQGEVLLGEKIKEKLINARTEKQDNGRIVFYKIKDIKYHDEEHSKFIKSFLKRTEENKGSLGSVNPSSNTRTNTNPNNNTNPGTTSTDPKSLIKGFY
ncbi:MAG: FeoB-associated Cys-rich membrane protein [Candidatus Pacearchaeota archaeon]|nr:FeoB-associated Cys-rich membrane protein [Candidatus Pacearchaeota archaeon]